jgi:hypothetical protein
MRAAAPATGKHVHDFAPEMTSIRLRGDCRRQAFAGVGVGVNMVDLSRHSIVTRLALNRRISVGIHSKSRSNAKMRP